MKTIPNDLIHSFNHTDNSEGNKSGLTKREHIMIEMQKAVIIGVHASTPKGDYHGWSHKEMADQALLYTDAVINALNDNP